MEHAPLLSHVVLLLASIASVVSSATNTQVVAFPNGLLTEFKKAFNLYTHTHTHIYTNTYIYMYTHIYVYTYVLVWGRYELNNRPPH